MSIVDWGIGKVSHISAISIPIYEQNPISSKAVPAKKDPVAWWEYLATGYFHRREKSSKPLGVAGCWIVPIPKKGTEWETGLEPETSTP